MTHSAQNRDVLPGQFLGLVLNKLNPAEQQQMTKFTQGKPTSKAPFTRYNRLSNPLSNRYDNRLYRVYKHSTSC